MPPSGEGYYFFATHFTVIWNEFAYFDLRVSGEVICSDWEDTETTNDADTGGCTAVVFLQEGNFVMFTVQTPYDLRKKNH